MCQEIYIYLNINIFLAFFYNAYNLIIHIYMLRQTYPRSSYLFYLQRLDKPLLLLVHVYVIISL